MVLILVPICFIYSSSSHLLSHFRLRKETVSRNIYNWPKESVHTVVHAASRRTGLDPELIMAVIQVESNGNSLAVSPKGAKGLMQLMPAVCLDYNVSDPFDMEQNIMAGSSYLSNLVRSYNGNLKLALASYNAGPGKVNQYGGVPPYPETRDYIKKILNIYENLRG